MLENYEILNSAKHSLSHLKQESIFIRDIWKPGSEESKSQCNRQWTHRTPCQTMLQMQKFKEKLSKCLEEIFTKDY